MRLKEKVAIVSGGGTGIGEAIAHLFAKEGARVVVTGRRKEMLDGVVREIVKSGGQALAVSGSVTVETDVQRAVAETICTFGRIDILINNAGNFFYSAPLHETTDAVWNETLAIFLTGVFRFTRAVIPQMLLQGGGAIVNISSIAGIVATEGWPAHSYAASKAGVDMLTKTVAIEYAKRGIRCNAVCPAGVNTPGVATVLNNPKARADFDAMHPIGRMGTSNEVAYAALYFASDESLWTTGSILAIDGGMTAR